jgi:hypothetical protein
MPTSGGILRRRLKQATVVVVVVFATAQFIRPERANPATDASQSIQANVGTANGLVAILDRACGDCHSNRTVWPWYTQVAPLSWVMAAGVKKGREVVNFSEWSSYSTTTQDSVMVMACKAVSEGTMPGRVWTTLHPEARVSAQGIATICAAAR